MVIGRFGLVVFWGFVSWTATSLSLAAAEPAFGLPTRPAWTTSKLIGTPDPPPPYTVARLYPELKFDKPVFVAQEPGTDRIFVAELGGKIFSFPKSNPVPDAKTLFLDIERQIYAFSFHPRYRQNGHVFVFSPTDPKDKSKEKKSRVSRFQAAGNPPTAARDTETIIIEWLAGGHNGGEAIIGPDGYLYISTGDSTSGSDPKSTGQGVNDLFSVIMRLDVDHPEKGRAYSIPPDNPFVNYPGARPEIWAHGFRNPWRLSFDREGNLWCGDVGQDLWEMIWRVEKGGNYGWSVQEGSHPFHPEKKRGPGPILPPIVEHHHSECRSITGGYVYYGQKHPPLNGTYIYGDYEYGIIWGFRFDGQKAVEKRVLADTALRIPTFAVTRDGEFIVVDHPSGELYELVEAPPTKNAGPFPRRLSETGLLASVKEHQLADGVIPYSVNAPQWIDNGSKQRFLGLPGDAKIKFGGGTWSFEDGTVAAETISLEMEVGNPASKRRIETRVLVKQQNHWLGYSYLWNDAQTDADLVGARGRDVVFQIRDPNTNNGRRQQTWHIPSRNECMFCHSRAATFVLGLRTEQVNKNHDYGGVIDNQLRAMDHAGVFAKPINKPPKEWAALSNPYDTQASLDARARVYLHVNCSICHVADGGGNAKIVLRHNTKLADMNLFDQPPMHGRFGLTDSHLVTPGDPFASVLFYRFSKMGRGRMPHTGSNLTDSQGWRLLHDWIRQLPDNSASSKATANSSTKVATPPSSTKITEHPDVELAAAELGSDVRDGNIDRWLSSTRQAFVVSRLVSQNRLDQAVAKTIIARAVAHTDPNIRDLFERFIPENQRTQRLGDLVNAASILQRKGNAKQGRQLFFNAAGLQCKNCHRIQQTGGTLGADLSHIGKKYKPHELLESLIEPSKKIDPKFVTQMVVTTDGKVLTGILRDKSDTTIVLNVFKNGQSQPVKIATADVDEIIPQKNSLMPERLLRDLTPQQAADLLAFLVSLK